MLRQFREVQSQNARNAAGQFKIKSSVPVSFSVVTLSTNSKAGWFPELFASLTKLTLNSGSCCGRGKWFNDGTKTEWEKIHFLLRSKKQVKSYHAMATVAWSSSSFEGKWMQRWWEARILRKIGIFQLAFSADKTALFQHSVDSQSFQVVTFSLRSNSICCRLHSLHA